MAAVASTFTIWSNRHSVYGGELSAPYGAGVDQNGVHQRRSNADARFQPVYGKGAVAYRMPTRLWTQLFGPQTDYITGDRTRFYLPSAGATVVTPAFDAGWEDTSIAARLATTVAWQATAATQVDFTDVDVTDKDILFRQWISLPLSGAQSIPVGTIHMQLRAIEMLATNNMFATFSAKIVSNDGSTVRGTILAITRDDVEVDPSTLTNRMVSATGGSVSALDGDRFVFEVGTGGTPTAATHSSSISIGDDNTVDLDYGDVTTAAFNPWIELPGSYVFGAEAVTDVFIEGLHRIHLGIVVSTAAGMQGVLQD